MRGHWVRPSTQIRRPRAVNEQRLNTSEEERALLVAWKAGDRKAGGALVQAFLPFVVSIALEYRRWNSPMEDIVQQGCLGLLKAASRFDLAQNVRLVTYAAYWIRAEIRDYVLRSYRMVRVGTTKSERRALRLFRSTAEHDPAALAKASGMAPERVQALLPLLSAGDISLDAPCADGSVSFQDRLASSDPSPEDQVMRELDGSNSHATLLGVLDELSSREQLIARERWLADDPATLEALGVQLGVTKERVRQIEDRTRKKLQARLADLKVA